MDLLDKRILILLDRNCRMTYRSIGDQVDLTANAVKKRIESMIEDGTIVKFNLMPTQAMSNLTFHFGIVETTGKEKPSDFMDSVAKSDIIAQVSQLAYGEEGGYAIFGQYGDARSLADSLSYIRRIDGVKEVEIHNAVTNEGRVTVLTSPQKRILREIVEDPRMSISEIAGRSGLSARRVRKELDMLLESNAFHFGVRWNLASAKNNHVLIYTSYSKEFDMDSFFEHIYAKYELEAWASIPSAIEPLIVTQIVTQSLSKIPKMISAIKKHPGIESIRDHVVYRSKKYPWPAEKFMKDLLE